MSIIDKIKLIGGLIIIFFPIGTVTVAMIMDAIYEYFDDKWVEGRLEEK